MSRISVSGDSTCAYAGAKRRAILDALVGSLYLSEDVGARRVGAIVGPQTNASDGQVALRPTAG
eukprot:5016018-Pyramimonas_sp.AAC.2